MSFVHSDPFVHNDPEFDGLVRIVATKRGLALALVEKDYWVTHVLWALHEQGFNVWFKGGTSLSKGFDLIERFSEDLDLKLEAGTVKEMPVVDDWDRTGATVTNSRKTYFKWLAENLAVPGAEIRLEAEQADRHWRAAGIQAVYPGRHLAGLGPDMRPYVLLEIGNARVVPSVPCELTSFIHEELHELGQLEAYVDNRPTSVQCVHPVVTLLEKLDALGKRSSRTDVEPASYVRHYEDAARIAAAGDLPPLVDYAGARALAEEMCERRQLRGIPAEADPAFSPNALEHTDAIQRAYDRIGHMYWGERITLEEACSTLRKWIAANLG